MRTTTIFLWLGILATACAPPVSMLRRGHGSDDDEPGTRKDLADQGSDPSRPPTRDGDAGGPAEGQEVQIPTTFAGRTLTVGNGGTYTTIQQAVADAQPGDGIVIRGGKYAEALKVSVAGTTEKPITITISPGEAVTIDGSIELNGASNVHLVGLRVQNSPSFGIYGAGSKNIVIAGGAVGNSQNGGIVFGDGSSIVIDRVEVHDNNAKGLSADHEAISLFNIDGFEVKGCNVHDNKEEGIDAKYESRNGKISGNHVHANNGPNIYVDSAHDIEIFGNLVHGAKGQKPGIMIAVEDYSETRKVAAIKVQNNVVFDNPAAVSFWRESTGSFTNISIVNNTFYRNDKANWGGLFNAGVTNDAFAGTNVVRNNIFWENGNEISDDDEAFVGFTIDHNLFKTGASSATFGNDSTLTANPGFVDLAAANVKLVPGSPAIDKGAGDGAPGKDFASVARPRGAGIDLGAFEF